MEDTLQKYAEMVKNDLDINEINIDNVARALPSKRHFWTTKLIDNKIELLNLKKLKDDAVRNLTSRVNAESPIKLTTGGMAKVVVSNNIIKDFDDKIARQEIMIEFLEKVEKNFFSASYDVKNIIELIKLQQT